MEGVDLVSKKFTARRVATRQLREWNFAPVDKRPPSVSTFALHLRHNVLSYLALVVALGSADIYRRFDLDARPVD
jgi:hypothetical protein